MLAKDRNIYIPQGYFNSDKEFKKVLQYVPLTIDGYANSFPNYCFWMINKYGAIIHSQGSSCIAPSERNISVFKPTHINRLIPFTRDLGEL